MNNKAFKPVIYSSISLIFVLMFMNCSNVKPSLPQISTNKAFSITQTRALCGGNIISDGSLTISESGICWSTKANATINDSKTTDGGSGGFFNSFLTDVKVGVTYYIRAYATNSKGTAYGEEVTFTHQVFAGTVTDIDSNVYKTIKVGSIELMAENIKTTKLSDGTPIALVAENSAWIASAAPSYCWYNNDIKNKDVYGALYNWETVNTKKICPIGWSVPTDSIWKIINDSLLGGSDNAGNLMKETGTAHWLGENDKATNESGFTAIPGGFREKTGVFYIQGQNGFWWSASAHNEQNAMYFYIDNENTSINHSHIYRNTGLSVRCVKN